MTRYIEACIVMSMDNAKAWEGTMTKEWLEENKDVAYLGHRTADAHERLVAAVKAAIKEKEE